VPHGVGSDRSHTVRFYEDESYLAGAVSDFLAGGLVAGQPLVVFATETRRDAVTRRLGDRGFDVDAVCRTGQLKLFDAARTLSRFMRGAVPDADRFHTTIGQLIRESLGARPSTGARAYGEMVDLLWKDGNTDGALRLESLWNELLSEHDVTLLCAYALGNFYTEAHTSGFEEICRHHSQVIPTERYTEAEDGARLLEVTILQQRARALEREIEHRKELERRLRESLRARQVAEAERERLFEGERIARAEAEAASRAKSDFLAVMSHELRTPLNAIGGHVQLIEMGIHGPVTEAQRAALHRIERSQRHLLALINDVLNLARVEARRVEYVIVDIPLFPLIDDIAAMMAPLLSAKDLALVIGSPGGGATDGSLMVRADREKVHQILVNLLTNAIKFTPPGGRITVDPAMLDDGRVEVRVSDTGIGIPDAKLETIFEPFVQLATRPQSGEEGLGLGLAISRDLARGMGGDITASSRPDAGSTLTLSLQGARL
jgi:signal transduction histidine kinase